MICNELHVDGACESLPMLNETQILAEPMGRNTAPAILWAALELEARGQSEDIMVVLPADQDVQNAKAWHDALQKATAAASGSHCNFRYRATAQILATATSNSRKLRRRPKEPSECRRFMKSHLRIEPKPLAEGNYVWNAGVFVARASTFIAEGERLKPGLIEGLRNFMTIRNDGGDRAAFAQLNHLHRLCNCRACTGCASRTSRLRVVGCRELRNL